MSKYDLTLEQMLVFCGFFIITILIVKFLNWLTSGGGKK